MRGDTKANAPPARIEFGARAEGAHLWRIDMPAQTLPFVASSFDTFIGLFLTLSIPDFPCSLASLDPAAYGWRWEAVWYIVGFTNITTALVEVRVEKGGGKGSSRGEARETCDHVV